MSFDTPVSGVAPAQYVEKATFDTAINAAIAAAGLALTIPSVRISDSSAVGRALLTAASVSAQRAALGLGSIALRNLIGSTDIEESAVTLSKLADRNPGTFMGRRAGEGLGAPQEISAIQARAILNVADGATANASDEALRARATHTGTQAISTVSGLQVALDSKAAAVHTHSAGQVVDSSSKVMMSSTERAKLAATQWGAQINAVNSVSGKTGDIELSKIDVGLAAVDNVPAVQLRDRSTHTGTQSIATVAGLSEALAAKAALVDVASARVGRQSAPGQSPTRFRKGFDAAAPVWSPSDVVLTEQGPALRVIGAGYVIKGDAVPIGVTDTDELRFSVIRTALVDDPAGDGIRFGVVCYDASGNVLAGSDGFVAIGADIIDLSNVGATTARRGAISRSLQPGVDVVLPSATRSYAPAVRAFGANPGLGVLQCEHARLPGASGSGVSIRPDAAGSLAARATYDAEGVGFVYLRTDGAVWEYYTRVGASGVWAGPATLQGPAGNDGDDGVITSFETYAAAAAWLAAATRPDGLTISVGENDYLTQAGSTDVPVLAHAVPKRPAYPQQWGFVGDGTQADTQRFQDAITQIGEAGGGKLTLPPRAGGLEYMLASLTPTASNWDNRYALSIMHDDVTIEAIGGALLRMGAGQEGHVLRVGQRIDGTVMPKRARLLGLIVDMDRATKSVFGTGYGAGQNSAFMVQAGCDEFVIDGCRSLNSVHYAFGVQRAGVNFGRISNCYGENCGGDIIDWKDDSGGQIGNRVENIVGRNWGQDSALIGVPQSAFDFRSGIMARGLVGVIDDGRALNRDGIRVLAGSPNETPRQPTKVQAFVLHGDDAALGVTRAVRAISRWASFSDGFVQRFSDAISMSNPDCTVSHVDAYFCGAGIRLWQDSNAEGIESDQAGLHAIRTRQCNYGIVADSVDNAMLTDCYFLDGTIGADIRAGSSNLRMIGGGIFGNTTNVQDFGTNTVFRNVTGLRTRSRRIEPFDVDAAGVQTLTIAHNLGVTPSIGDVQISLARQGSVADYVAQPLIVSATATEIVIDVNVAVASAVPDAKSALVVDVSARQTM